MSPSHFVRGVIVRGSAEIRHLNKSYLTHFVRLCAPQYITTAPHFGNIQNVTAESYGM